MSCSSSPAFAERLNSLCQIEVREAQNNDREIMQQLSGVMVR